MDGQIILPVVRSNFGHYFKQALVALSLCIGAAVGSHNAFGQAMGTATVDSLPPATAPAVVAPVATTPVVAPTPAPAPAVVPTPAPAPRIALPIPAPNKTTTATTAAPERKLPAPIVEAKPATPEVLEPKPEVLPLAPKVEKIVDSVPADSAKPAVSAMDQKPIHGAAPPAAALANTTENKTAPNNSFLPSGVASVIEVVAALAVVLGLIFIGKAMARKFLPGDKASNGKGVIEILARYPLCKNQSLVLVRIGSQIVTLNQGKDQSQSVLVINDANEVAKIMGQIEGTSPKSIQAGFNRLLSNARMDLETANPDSNDFESRSMEPENLDTQLEEMAAAKRQLMELRRQVRSVRDSLPR